MHATLLSSTIIAILRDRLLRLSMRKKRRDPCESTPSKSVPSVTRQGRYRNSPPKPDRNLDKAPPEQVPNQLKAPRITAREVSTVSTGDKEPLWVRTLSDERVRQDVLRHVARCSDHPWLKKYAEEDWHLLFDIKRDKRYKPASACVRLLPGEGFFTRSGRYSGIVLGTETAGKKESWAKYVDIDGHRLVCWLTRGPPKGDQWYALHSCDNKECVRTGHLAWGSQSANIQKAANKKRVSSEKKRGALMLLQPLLSVGFCLSWTAVCKPLVHFSEGSPLPMVKVVISANAGVHVHVSGHPEVSVTMRVAPHHVLYASVIIQILRHCRACRVR